MGVCGLGSDGGWFCEEELGIRVAVYYVVDVDGHSVADQARGGVVHLKIGARFIPGPEPGGIESEQDGECRKSRYDAKLQLVGLGLGPSFSTNCG